MEIWKDIEESELHQISSFGNVKNKKTNKIIKGDINNAGYKRVTFGNKHYFIHRLVAKYFCKGYKDGLIVNHIDGNKTNNNMNNLEWVTRSENDLHAFKLKLRKVYPCTFKHRIIKYDLNTNEIICIYDNTKECEKDLKVARTNIYNTCNGIQSSCRGYGLRYE